MAIDKPSGLASHSLTETDASCESILKAESPDADLRLVHRLDTGTSGVLLFAKGEIIFNEMRELFKLKRIQKRYLAWSEKTEGRAKLMTEMGLPYRMEWSLAHHPKSKKRMIAIPPDVTRTFRGKPILAVTLIHGVREDDFFKIPSFRFEIEIITGVMHQIRVHLQSLGFALIGDAIYEKPLRDPLVRLALHALSIEFELRAVNYRVVSPEISTKNVELL